MISNRKIKNINRRNTLPPNKISDQSITKERSIRSLRGKGKKIWSTVDVEQYIATERNGWGN